jgi:hypothetical protein
MQEICANRSRTMRTPVIVERAEMGEVVSPRDARIHLHGTVSKASYQEAVGIRTSMNRAGVSQPEVVSRQSVVNMMRAM